MDVTRKTGYLLSEFVFNIPKEENDNKGPENVIQCEGGSYLDLQYEYQSSTQ